VSAPPVVEAADLRVVFPGGLRAVRGVSFTLGRERLGFVGESGSGKSTVCRALLGLVPASARIEAERLSIGGRSVLGLTPRGWRDIRGKRAGMILQDARYSLNPVLRVGTQIAETFRAHHRISRAEARRRTLASLEAVRIDDPESVYRRYPHEISGGMGQRVMIAMMLAPEPDVLVADEPTSALDVTVAARVLATLDDLVTRRGMGLILVSHNLDLVGRFCDRVLVMHRGRVVEELRGGALDQATHPYTRGLLAASPRLDRPMAELPVLARDRAATP
jgi:peptide/nickel transport system ATP-binding protein